MQNSPDNKNKNKKYDKIKHLVEVDDDILAVFSIESSAMGELYIAENANIDKNYIDSLIRILEINEAQEGEKPLTFGIKQEVEGKAGKEEDDNNILGKIKWIVIEYDKMRILKLFEDSKTIFVLINSNTQLEHTVDNILGYYYDLDDIPKSLF